MKNLREHPLFKVVFNTLWISILLFPILVMKVSVVTGVASIQWRWKALPILFISALLLNALWYVFIYYREKGGFRAFLPRQLFERFSACPIKSGFSKGLYNLQKKEGLQRFIRGALFLLATVFVLLWPWLFGLYQTDIMVTALIYVILALGLNIIVGLGGLLNLGHAAFFAVGAYTYGLLWNFLGPHWVEMGFHPGLLFWIALPLSGIVAMIFGVLLSLPVLRLRGDYLAIVTLAFGEIVRMFLQNMTTFTGGAQGIRRIPRPWFFGLRLKSLGAMAYMFYITLFFVVLAVIIVRRLENSRVGRALEGMREDEIACQSVGINLVKNKLITFVLGAFWAGIAGTLFAAKTTFINPDSFTLWESIMILMAVVIGGTGSIPGVIAGALILKLLPEWFRPLAQYRMIIYGVAMILIIIFKSDGLIPRKRKAYVFKKEKGRA